MRSLKTTFLLILFFGLLGCHAQNKVLNKKYEIMLQSLLTHDVKEITVKEVVLDTSNTVFLDTREKSEYKVSHIKNAIWAGYNSFSFNKLKEIDKDAKIVVYCSVGYRSEKISQKLIKKGFTNVSNLYGGIFEWKNQGHEVYLSSNFKTENVHAFDKSWGIWLEKGNKVY